MNFYPDFGNAVATGSGSGKQCDVAPDMWQPQGKRISVIPIHRAKDCRLIHGHWQAKIVMVCFASSRGDSTVLQ
jgi:hypothetical protein